MILGKDCEESVYWTLYGTSISVQQLYIIDIVFLKGMSSVNAYSSYASIIIHMPNHHRL
jgi:hypothetical protein